jgi:hypothetical protein
MANILNILNTNSVNSEGVLQLANYFNVRDGDIDFRNAATSTLGCMIEPCKNVEGLQVNLLNDAYIKNIIALTATSGDNRIDGGGDATIKTGDAYAGLNLVNVANTNFIDSNYLLVSLNAFKDVNGDIVFPGLSKFFSTLSPGSVNLTNTALIDNQVALNADAGNNHADTASSTIQTGTAQSVTNVFNSLNTSLIGGDTVQILLRVHGKWVGDVFGAPSNLTQDKDDSTFFLSNGTSTLLKGADINATNTAEIHNDVSLAALTGNNEITGAETGLITTGDAFAGANLINIANANVVGKNWVLAIINIFGDFNGNLAFGRPDLWVGEQVNAPAHITDGSVLEYKYTVINNGDSEASRVRMSNKLDSEHLEVIDSSVTYESTEGGLSWNIGTLPPGGATEITYHARVHSVSPGTDIVDTVTVRGYEPDNNMEDNTDTVTVRASEYWWVNASEDRTPRNLPATATVNAVTVERTTPAATVFDLSGKVKEKLIIHNTFDFPVDNVIVHDIIYDPAGRVLQNEDWELGKLQAHEEVAIEYDVQFGPAAMTGLYTLSTALKGNNEPVRTFEKNGSIYLLPVDTSTMTQVPPLLSEIIPIASATPATASEPAMTEPEPVLVEQAVVRNTAAAGDIPLTWLEMMYLVLLALALGFGGIKLYKRLT